MDYVDCMVRHRGDNYHKTPKLDITVAEVACLRHLHGDDAIVEIRKKRRGRPAARTIRDQLSELYGEPTCAALFGASSQTVTLPKTLGDIGIPPHSPLIANDQREEEKKRGDGRMKTNAAIAAEEDDIEEDDIDEDDIEEDDEDAEEVETL